MQECHGHNMNVNCLKCEKYNPKSFSWNMVCPENKQMLDYKLFNNIKSKKNNNEKLTKFEKNVLKSFENKINKNNFYKKGDFYYNFDDGLSFFTKNKSLLVKIINIQTGNELMKIQTIPDKIYCSLQKFYVKWGIQVYENNKIYFEYELNLKNQNVLIISNSTCLGDNIAFIESVSTFQKKHDCNLYYLSKHDISSVLAFNYPNIKFIKNKNNKRYKAVYHLSCGSMLTQYRTIVYDRIISLEKIPLYILDVPHVNRQKLKITEKIDFNEKYVVYSEKASSAMKEWNNPSALKEVVTYLQNLGYTVVNIDIKPYNKKIPNVIYLNDKKYSLQDKVNIISGADFFIGLPSGLSWLSWACHIPTIVLGSFSLPLCEFENPYRIFSTDYCFGCWNYYQQMTNCFYNPNDKKFSICNKGITAKQVINMINRLMEDLKLK